MAMQEALKKAADAIAGAEALVITAGAGMGVDSGLPDFRGDRGFWKAYPMYEKLGINFVAAANPEHFERDPAFGWGFYGHRTNLYRQTEPHAGFAILKRWLDGAGRDGFVVTSNVDGQFQKAGFAEEQILEVHGSIHHLQCLIPCRQAIWENDEQFEIDFATMRSATVPTCRFCGGTARPNILMFGDYSWLPGRSHGQQMRFDLFCDQHRGRPLAVIEMGAGTAIPTIRHLSERIGAWPEATVIRINPREAQIRPPHISLACGALEGLQAIDRLLAVVG
ncbi:SIR2 family NAD-dependent protein deacylase [Geothermobacter ehrlichii]|uniref:SIR2 family NAD-dependent protein deacylase n=1 Tax=Geothermobacter ehrlichii TaxID=213224 RepID=UPI0011E6CF51